MVQINILMDDRGIITACTYADYVSLNTYEAKEYVTSERPTALFIFDDSEFLIMFIWGCRWAKWGQTQWVQRGVGGLSERCHGNCKGVLRVIKPGKKMHACVWWRIPSHGQVSSHPWSRSVKFAQIRSMAVNGCCLGQEKGQQRQRRKWVFRYSNAEKWAAWLTVALTLFFSHNSRN